jgi:hypothetical protein
MRLAGRLHIMVRIYCDFNDGIDETRYSLSCAGSMEDIERLSDQLHDGLRVVLYQTHELEAEGTIEFDTRFKCWVGTPDWSTIRYLDEDTNAD